MKRVSIIIPVFNAEYYLEKCLSSVLRQTYPHFECIIVNDGSTDGSSVILESYVVKDSRFKLINQSNKGLAISRQVGFNNAKYEYITTIDADDYIDNRFIEIMLKSALDSNADITICNFYKVNDENSLINNIPILNSTLLHITDDVLINEYSHIAAKSFLSDSWAKLYKTSFVHESKVIFNTPKKFNGTDFLFNHKILLHKPTILYIKDYLYYYNTSNLESLVRRKGKDLLSSFDYIIQELTLESQVVGLEQLEMQISLIYLRLLKQAATDYINNNNKKYDKVFIEFLGKILSSNNVTHRFDLILKSKTSLKNKILVISLKNKYSYLTFLMFKKIASRSI